MSENPSVFPKPSTFSLDGGMTLRDWFAGQAVSLCWKQANALADSGGIKPDYALKLCAGMAYTIADAMLAERAKMQP